MFGTSSFNEIYIPVASFRK